MGLRMKNYNILGVKWKTQLIRGGFTKNQYRGGFPKKGGLGQFADLRGGGGGKKERGMVFLREGVDTPMHTMISFYNKLWLFVSLIQKCQVLRSNLLYGYLLVTSYNQTFPSISTKQIWCVA